MGRTRRHGASWLNACGLGCNRSWERTESSEFGELVVARHVDIGPPSNSLPMKWTWLQSPAPLTLLPLLPAIPAHRSTSSATILSTFSAGTAAMFPYCRLSASLQPQGRDYRRQVRSTDGQIPSR